MATKTETIFVQLLDEGTYVIKPVEGLKIKDNVFKIIEPSDYDPEDENWEFKPNAVVNCEQVSKDGKTYLVAKSEVDQIE